LEQATSSKTDARGSPANASYENRSHPGDHSFNEFDTDYWKFALAVNSDEQLRRSKSYNDHCNKLAWHRMIRAFSFCAGAMALTGFSFYLLAKNLPAQVAAEVAVGSLISGTTAGIGLGLRGQGRITERNNSSQRHPPGR
jgi:hypothetical protein